MNIAFVGNSPMLANKRVLLLEATKTVPTLIPDESAPFSNRVYAMSPGSKAILDRLGIWEHVWRTQDVLSLQVWDALSDASITFSNPGFEDPVAHIVESAVLSYAIQKVLSKVKGAVVLFMVCS